MINSKTPFNVSFLLLSAIVFYNLTSCAERGSTKDTKEVPGADSITVVTTTTQIYDLVNQIAGDQCKVISLMGPGIDPHLYKPTARDMQALSSADMIFFHGLKLEGKLSTVLKRSEESKIPIHEVCSVIPANLLLDSAESGKSYPDPHVWFSPTLWSICMHGVAAVFCDLIPEKKDLFIERSNDLEEQFSEIEQWAKVQFSKISPKRRKIITSHDAFRYLGRSFDMEVIGLQGISTATEAGLGDRTNLVDFIKEYQIPVLFVESSVNPKALKEIAKETGSALGKPLFSDAFGADEVSVVGPSGNKHALSTWTGMMTHNVNALVDGLAENNGE